MVRVVGWVPLAVTTAAATVFAAGQTFTSSWLSPDAAGTSFAGRKVAALVMVDDLELQMSAEEALVRELAALGIDAVAAYRMIPREELKNADAAKGWFERVDVQGVVVLRPVAVETSRRYAPTVWSTAYYSTLWGYYGSGWVGVYNPGAVREDTTLVVETLIYSVPRNMLLWAGVSETKNPRNVGGFMKGLVAETIKEMRKQGFARASRR